MQHAAPAFRGIASRHLLLEAAVYDGHDFGLKFAYFDGIGTLLKPFKGWFFREKDHPYFRYWRLARWVVDQSWPDLFKAMRTAAGEAVIADADRATALIEAARAKPIPSAFLHGLSLSIYPMDDGAVGLIGSTYHPGVVALAKNMRGIYLPAMRAWKISRATPLQLRENLIRELGISEDQVTVFEGMYGLVDDNFSQIKFSEIGISIGGEFPEGDGSPHAEDDATGSEVYLATTAPLSRSHFSEVDIAKCLTEYSLYDYQQVGVRHLVTQSSALLADDMGLGKTRQAVVAADIVARGTGRVLIACPASLMVNWTREIRLILPQASVCSQRYDAEARWVVVNYERLEHVAPFAGEFAVMIVDEAHLLKEPSTARTRVAFEIASKVPYRYLLTGTPILNRECELHTLLRLSGHPVGQMPLRAFEEQFSGDPAFRAALNQQIGTWMLRRKKDTVLTLKGKQRQVLPIAPALVAKQRYETILRNPDKGSFEKIFELRQWLESIKTEAIIEAIQETGADDKWLVFCEYKNTVRELKQRIEALGYRAVSLTGDDSHTRRQKTVDAFQQDPDIRVFIGTTMAAGVGLNLTAANYVAFASLPWTAALLEQAEDRAYRNGQQRLVIVKIPLVDDTIDAMLWDMLRHKKSIASEVIEPGQAETLVASHLAAAIAA